MTSILASARILLVDDHAAIHDDLRKMLQPPDGAAEKARRAMLDFLGDAPPVIAPRGSAFEFADAFQGNEAVELARAAHAAGRPFDLAIVDMRMPPGIDGLETAVRLRALQPELALLFCTAFSDHADGAIAARLGSMNHAIEHKPLDPRRLRERVDALLRR